MTLIQVFPVPQATPDNFGWDGDPFNNDPGFNPDDAHDGHDIFGSIGYDVVCAFPGEVEKAGWNESGGWRVGVRGDNGLYYYYAHLNDYSVSVGQRVEAGSLLGHLGQTGEAQYTAPHLHIGIQDKQGNWIPGFFPDLKDAYRGENMIDTVKYAFVKYLGREADEGAIQSYSTRPANEVFTELRGSGERSDTIAKAFQTILGREPDAEGLNFYATSDMSILDIYKNMLASDEFAVRGDAKINVLRNLIDQLFKASR